MISIFCAATFPWFVTVIVNGMSSPNLTGVFIVVVLAKAKSKIVAVAGSASSSSVAGFSSPGTPVPSPKTTSSEAVITAPPASLVGSLSG